MGEPTHNAGRPPATDLLAAMQAFQQGDEQGFEQVYSQFWPAVCRRAAKMGLDEPDREDVAQKVLVRVYLYARDAEFAGVRRLWGWVYTIAAHEIYKHWKKKRPELIAADLPADRPADPPGAEPSPAQAAADEEVHRALTDCMAALPDPERLAVASVLVQGLTFRRAAAVAGATLGQFKHRYEKALRSLRECLRRKGHDIP